MYNLPTKSKSRSNDGSKCRPLIWKHFLCSWCRMSTHNLWPKIFGYQSSLHHGMCRMKIEFSLQNLLWGQCLLIRRQSSKFSITDLTFSMNASNSFCMDFFQPRRASDFLRIIFSSRPLTISNACTWWRINYAIGNATIMIVINKVAYIKFYKFLVGCLLLVGLAWAFFGKVFSCTIGEEASSIKCIPLPIVAIDSTRHKGSIYTW